VDDLDKSASLVGVATPRRSTSSLGAMSHTHRRAFLAAAIAGCTPLLVGCHTSPPPASQYGDDWKGLFLAVTKGLGARTYYVGSDDTWSYFQTTFEKSIFTPTYRKVLISQMRLRRAFPF